MERRRYSVLPALILMFVCFVCCFDVVRAQDGEPVREINIVYDDSGSMIVDGSGAKCDTWCQAKYAMEVFAAMLGAQDTMNIYVMSDFQSADDAPPLLTLHGTSSDSDNVKEIHNMLTPASKFTTFTTVEKAYEDLRTVSADEKWLIVLTDGEFNKPSKMSGEQLEEYFSQKDEDVNIMFFGMGPAAAAINPDEENHIYFEKAETSSDILSNITKICNRIFNTNKLDVDVSSGSFAFDVPMGELVVFAQGEGVKINDVKEPGGGSLSGGSEPVGVKFSERACSNDTERYADPMISRDLVGSLVTYKGLYDSGTYTVEAENAETIEVYYKPSVEIMAFLKDKDGKEHRSNEQVEPGEYTLDFNFVKSGTNEKVEASDLLGEVTYSAYVSGTGADREYESGDKVSLSEGSYVIDAKAELPQFYTTVSTQLNMDVFWHRELGVTSSGENPVYYVDKDAAEGIDGFRSDPENPYDPSDPTKLEPTVISLSLDGAGLSAAEWAQIEDPVVEQVADRDIRVDFEVKKSDEIGVIEITPYLKSGKTDILDGYHDIDIKVTFSVDMEGQAWDGEVTQTIPIEDIRPWYWRHLDKVWKLAVLGFVLFIIAGYLPIFKKYLPKKLKAQPTVDCKPNRPGKKKYERKGKYTKKTITTFIPYKAETGRISIVPSGVAGPPELQVKATESGRRMELTNTGAYVNIKGITFNGNPVNKNGKKNISLTASATIVYKTADTTYSCTLNR